MKKRAKKKLKRWLQQIHWTTFFILALGLINTGALVWVIRLLWWAGGSIASEIIVYHL